MNALDLIHKMFRPNEVMQPYPETLTAVVNPFTGDDYISLGKIDPPAEWLPRGTFTRLHFEQESGGGFALCFGFHKGNTYAWIENEDNPFDD